MLETLHAIAGILFIIWGVGFVLLTVLRVFNNVFLSIDEQELETHQTTKSRKDEVRYTFKELGYHTIQPILWPVELCRRGFRNLLRPLP